MSEEPVCAHTHKMVLRFLMSIPIYEGIFFIILSRNFQNICVMKLLWLDLNSSYAHSSLALPALHAQFDPSAPIEWSKISATINENPGMTAGEVSKQKPDIVAATCWVFNHEMLMHTLCRVHALLPECRIILGGPEFLGDNRNFLLKNDFIDCVFRGEGEEMFPAWLEVWNEKSKWNDIIGLCYFDAEGDYHDQGRAQVKHFAELKSPEESSFFNWDKPFVQLETTRGCFNTCSFCVSGGEKPVRSQPLEKIVERVKNIHSHGIKNIRMLDRTFNYNTRYAKSLLELFRTYPDIRYHLEIHPALLSQELKDELPSLPKGLLHLEAGIQSLHQNVLDTSRRKGKLEPSMEGLKYLCSLDNMETHADLIAGLPLYHLEQIFDDIRVLAEYHTGEIQLESLKLLPGTEMRRRAQELGIKYSSLPPYEVLETNEITADELQTARLLSRMLDFYYNAKPWQEITRKLILENEDFLHRFLDYLIKISVIDAPLSLERRGIILYQFCQNEYPAYLADASQAWIEAGMSLKKQPAEHVRTKHVTPPHSWDVIFGEYHEGLRLCKLPLENEGTIIWYGFVIEEQGGIPIFKATSSTDAEVQYHKSQAS